MVQNILASDREIFSVIVELTKAVRCCRQDEVLCGDVTFTQFIILDTIALNRTLNIAALHKILSVEKSTTTRLVAPLIKRNLIVREKSDEDSRAAILELTEEGKKVHEKVWQNLVSFIRTIKANIPEEKRDASLEGIHLFINALQNASAVRTGTNKHIGRHCC